MNNIHLKFEKPKVCVLILNYQSYGDTIKYINCLQKQEDIDLSILVVDNCSPNDSFKILSRTYSSIDNVSVITSKRNGGYAYGNNFGLKFLQNSDIDFIVISNNDIEIANYRLLIGLVEAHNLCKNPGFIAPVMLDNNKVSKLAAWKIPSFKDNLIGSLSFLEFIFGGKYFYRGRRIYKNEYLERGLPVECVPGSFYLSRKNIFYEIGLMDENTFLYMEEAILGVKIREKGFNNYIISDLFFNHLTSQTISENVSYYKMHKFEFESKLYFNKNYLKTNYIGLMILNIMFFLWPLENYFVKRIKRILNK